MLNFNDSPNKLFTLKDGDEEFDNNKKIDMERIKFYNSLYNKDDLSSYILVDKKRKPKPKKNED